MLFDGTAASLENWNQAGPGSFELGDDCTIKSVGGMGLLWYDEQFGAYSLKLDWKMAGDDNSGVFVGFPDPGDDPWVAVNEGYEIQIDPTDDPDKTTGAIYGFQSADLEARDAALNPPGEWNSYEIVVRDQTIQVYLNDTLINDFVSTDPNRDLTQGFVGLQNHGDEDEVWFRNVQIRDLDTTAPVTEASFAEPGANGWHNGEVGVTLTATDEGSGVERIEYSLDGGDWTTYTEPVVISGDGEHTMLYRAVDKAGNVENDKAVTIRIDGTAPTVMIAGVADGFVYGDAEELTISWEARDGTSGVESAAAELDGEALESGTTVPLYPLDLGEHSLTVSATDKAGNTAEHTLTFTSTTSFDDVASLIRRFAAEDKLTTAEKVVLSAELALAKRASEGGRTTPAVVLMRLFIGMAQHVSDDDARDTLVRDGRALLGHIDGSAPIPVVS